MTNEGENVDDIDYAANVPADAVDGENSDDTASDDESSENEDTDVSDVDVKTAAKSDDDTGNDGSGDNSGDSVVLGDDVSDGSGSASDTDVDLNAFHRATLAGTMFEIRNASDKAVIVDGKLYQVGQVVKTITTNAQGYAATEPTALPFGTYDVYEVGAPNGYISSADSYGNADGVDDVREKTYVQTVEIREQGVIVPCARPFANQIKRGDITFQKIDDDFQKIDDDGNVMPHVAFRVTSKTTGESHIIVTDENGVYNSSSSVIPHSQNTNANDDAFDADGNVDDDALVHDAGTWFYGKADGKPFYTDEQYTLPNYNDRFGASYVDDSADTDADTDASDGDKSDSDSDDETSDNDDDSDERAAEAERLREEHQERRRRGKFDEDTQFLCHVIMPFCDEKFDYPVTCGSVMSFVRSENPYFDFFSDIKCSEPIDWKQVNPDHPTVYARTTGRTHIVFMHVLDADGEPIIERLPVQDGKALQRVLVRPKQTDRGQVFQAWYDDAQHKNRLFLKRPVMKDLSVYATYDDPVR